MGRFEDLIRRGMYQLDPEALFELGEMYRDGDGVERDLAEAEKWFGKARHLGHAKAEGAIAALAAAEQDPELLEHLRATLLAMIAAHYSLEPELKSEPELVVWPVIVRDEPPVLKRKKKVSPKEHPYCPHGHGQVRSWQGELRCWTCGWMPSGGTAPASPGGVEAASQKKDDDSSGKNLGCVLLIIAIILWRACEEYGEIF